MSAVAIIERIRAAGGEISLAKGRINLRVPRSLREETMAEVRESKDAIKRVLRDEVSEPWDDEDYRSFYEERGGIAEVDGGQSREMAEAIAFECCVNEWLSQHPCQSDPGRCAACGKPDREGRVVVPFGTESHGHAWLHPECWQDWYEGRKADAVAALAAVGIESPAKFGKDGGH